MAKWRRMATWRLMAIKPHGDMTIPIHGETAFAPLYRPARAAPTFAEGEIEDVPLPRADPAISVTEPCHQRDTTSLMAKTGVDNLACNPLYTLSQVATALTVGDRCW